MVRLVDFQVCLSGVEDQDLRSRLLRRMTPITEGLRWHVRSARQSGPFKKFVVTFLASAGERAPSYKAVGGVGEVVFPMTVEKVERVMLNQQQVLLFVVAALGVVEKATGWAGALIKDWVDRGLRGDDVCDIVAASATFGGCDVSVRYRCNPDWAALEVYMAAGQERRVVSVMRREPPFSLTFECGLSKLEKRGRFVRLMGVDGEQIGEDIALL
jgi:hypothetical protein